MTPPAPLRFLALVLVGWIGLRVAALAPWSEKAAADAPQPGASQAIAPVSNPVRAAASVASALVAAPLVQPRVLRPSVDRPGPAGSSFAPTPATDQPEATPGPLLRPTALAAHAPPAVWPLAPPPTSASDRWSASAWLFARRGGDGTLATAGTLGGSQAGLRVGYRLNRDTARPLSLSGRLYAPLETDGAEAAVGLEWKPLADVPVRILAERRQRLSGDGRSAFAILAYGGVSEARIAGPLRLDAYAQAGMVGLHSKDLFADGAATVSLPLGARAQVGIGLWGAAQPGVSRLDAGPQVSVRLPVTAANLRLSAGYRVRVAGDALPASGPALTLAADF
ncbi:hypothetical protein SH591_10435 [Sphingomonas sp. LY54]|uniref:hypothetical protein n=1 Tax=Sphingomonas sp. LY54 TaxID=3095343 RepID=UPI002D77D0B6|nr:hypothetical protein [Sphingomonas sp. LY54]WRP27537.1 hypothetical protein SH591_10435 [Sphingomonas sp. LY54]